MERGERSAGGGTVRQSSDLHARALIGRPNELAGETRPAPAAVAPSVAFRLEQRGAVVIEVVKQAVATRDPYCDATVTVGLTVAQLSAIAKELRCLPSDLLARLEPAVFERSKPRPTYRHRPLVPPEPLPPSVHGVETAIAPRVGCALRAYRRANITKPIHLLARDAGMTYSHLMAIENGRSGRVVRLVHVADAYEVLLPALLREIGL